MSVRQLSTAGLLVGITIFLGIFGYGFIPLFAVNATILHIPTIIGAMAAGPKVGAMTGFFFGMFSFIQAFRSPAVMMQFASSYNPLYTLIICVVPRVAIGWIAWKLFRILPGKLAVRAGCSNNHISSYRDVSVIVLPSGGGAVCGASGSVSCGCSRDAGRYCRS